VCNGCQETLKLKAIEVHRCRSYFSCVDCGKDFGYDAVRAHNTCMSEAEKYEKTLYKPKGKGKKVDPQEAWTAQIAVAAAGAKKYRDFMARLLPYTNVPRKAPKFINFAKNSIGVRDDRVLQEMFDMIVAAAPPRPAPAAAAAAAAAGGGAGSAAAAAPAAAAASDDDEEEEAASAPAPAPAPAPVSGVKRARTASETAPAAAAAATPAGDKKKLKVKGCVREQLAAAEGGKLKAKHLRAAVVAALVSAHAYPDEAAAEAAVDKRLAKMQAAGQLVADGKYVSLAASAGDADDDE